MICERKLCELVVSLIGADYPKCGSSRLLEMRLVKFPVTPFYPLGSSCVVSGCERRFLGVNAMILSNYGASFWLWGLKILLLLLIL